MKKIGIIIFLLILGFASSPLAEEEVTEIVEETTETIEEADYSSAYGEVKAVDKEAKTITVSEYDYQKEKELDIIYLIKEDTEFEGVEDLSEIKEHDWVDIEYHIDEGQKRVADFVAVEIEPFFEEEVLGEESEIEGSEEEVIVE